MTSAGDPADPAQAASGPGDRARIASGPGSAGADRPATVSGSPGVPDTGRAATPGPPGAEHGPAGGESLRTILIALAVNVVVAVIKAIAGVLTASAGLLAEAAHSVGDCTTELFLITAVRRSDRPADRRHPFGYGKERYFWSLLAAMTIFTLGAGFSVYEGVHTITSGESDTSSPLVGYIVLGLSALVEGVSLRQASGQARRESRRLGMTLRQYLRDPDDPTVKSVFMEDSGAIIGLSIAAAGLILRQVTGDSVWDGAAALAIGALLVAIAFELARTNVGLLIGKQAHPQLVTDIRVTLAEQSDVLSVVDVRTMMIGTGKILVCARIDYVDGVTANQAERASLRMHRVLAERFADVEDVFIEPVPRDDRELQREAQARR